MKGAGEQAAEVAGAKSSPDAAVARAILLLLPAFSSLLVLHSPAKPSANLPTQRQAGYPHCRMMSRRYANFARSRRAMREYGRARQPSGYNASWRQLAFSGVRLGAQHQICLSSRMTSPFGSDAFCVTIAMSSSVTLNHLFEAKREVVSQIKAYSGKRGTNRSIRAVPNKIK